MEGRNRKSVSVPALSMTGQKESRRDVCRDCRVNLAISAALLYQTHDILQSALLTGQTVKSPTRFLEGKQ